MNTNSTITTIPTLQQRTETATQALRDLGQALTDQALFARLKEAIVPLQEEAQEKSLEAARLRNSHAELTPRVEARCRILQMEKDAAIAEGRDTEAEAKSEEAKELAVNLSKIVTLAQGCDRRVCAIAQEQNQLARDIFGETWPDFRQALVCVEASMADLLDKVWSDLQLYAEGNGLQGDGLASRPLVNHMTRVDLTPRENGPERVVFQRLANWFGPARR